MPFIDNHNEIKRNVQQQVGKNQEDIERLEKKALGGVLYRHHFDVILTYDDIPNAINYGETVAINVNALSNDSEPWETLSELDGKGAIISAFGTVVSPSIDYTKIFELKLFYKAIETLLIDVHVLSSHAVFNREF